MHLLFVTQDFPPDVGGIQTYSWELAPRLAHRCEQFHLVAPARPGDAEVDASLDFPVYRLPIRSDLLVLGAFPFIFQLGWHRSVDVAFHVQWQTALASLFARHLLGTPSQIAVALHGRDTVFNPFQQRPLRWGYNLLRRTTLGASDHVLPVSHFLARRAYELGATDPQTTVIPNATNPEVFYPDPDPLLRDKFNADERPVVLSAGRMVLKKGFDTALRALKLVREKIPDVLLLLAGSGPESSSLRQLTRDLDLESNVRFLGDLSQDQLRRYYTLADVFMMVGREIPDDVEGFGLVYLEANACGTPVIGARVGGVPDAIEDGQTGLLVPPENPDAAAAATIKLFTHPDFATTLGENGRRRVRSSLHWDAVADRIHDTLTAH